MLPRFKLKQPFVYDCYAGEYNVAVENPCYRAIFKASGRTRDRYVYRDTKFEEYVFRANNAGRKWGAYHFLTPHDISKQFDVFMSVIKKTGIGFMPLSIDVEILPKDYGVSAVEWGYQIKTFIDMIVKETGYKPIIYTNLYYWSFVNFSGWYPQDEAFLWVAQYPLAQYIDSTLRPYPLPKGWYNENWAIWQYFDGGRSESFFINDLNVVSDWFKTYLDSKWGETITPTPKKFPYSITINDKTYKEAQ